MPLVGNRFIHYRNCYICGKETPEKDDYELEVVCKTKSVSPSYYYDEKIIKIHRCRKCYDTYLVDYDGNPPSAWFYPNVGKWKYLIWVFFWIGVIMYIILFNVTDYYINEFDDINPLYDTRDDISKSRWVSELFFLFFVFPFFACMALEMIANHKKEKRRRTLTSFVDAIYDSTEYDSVGHADGDDIFNKRLKLKPRFNKTATIIIYCIVPLLYLFAWSKRKNKKNNSIDRYEASGGIVSDMLGE